MEIKKAIEILEIINSEPYTPLGTDDLDALHMGIAALKLFRQANINIDPLLKASPQLRLSADHLRQCAILFNTKSYPYPVPDDSPDEPEPKSSDRPPPHQASRSLHQP